MKVCIIGNSLTSLTLAKTLVNLGIYVDIFFDLKKKNQDKNRTIGISKSNVNFFNKEILNINKLLWKINNIDVYSQKLENKKILSFQNNGKLLFSIIRNDELMSYLIKVLKKDKFLTFKKNIPKYEFLVKNYKLIFNCDSNNEISKKYFYKKIDKDYNSYAHTTIIWHKKFTKNDIASQIFTKKGPLAFLPISEKQTSVVYSCIGDKNIELERFIRKHNLKYTITKINKVSCFKLQSSNLRLYRHRNILAFGDTLHRLHPLAGQGYNMTIRDIQIISKLIRKKTELGLELDNSILIDFEKKTKHKNYLFSNGIDFIYEFFNFENKIDTKILSKSVKFLGENKFIKNFFSKIADKGLVS
tara:strand:- start:523 stop:1596 length:1074 start_codon:yes stop_codon:yes gene_type:complete